MRYFPPFIAVEFYGAFSRFAVRQTYIAYVGPVYTCFFHRLQVFYDAFLADMVGNPVPVYRGLYGIRGCDEPSFKGFAVWAARAGAQYHADSQYGRYGFGFHGCYFVTMKHERTGGTDTGTYVRPSCIRASAGQISPVWGSHISTFRNSPLREISLSYSLSVVLVI